MKLIEILWELAQAFNHIGRVMLAVVMMGYISNHVQVNIFIEIIMLISICVFILMPYLSDARFVYYQKKSSKKNQEVKQ